MCSRGDTEEGGYDLSAQINLVDIPMKTFLKLCIFKSSKLGGKVHKSRRGGNWIDIGTPLKTVIVTQGWRNR